MRLATQHDKTHTEVASIMRRNNYPVGLRQWGMRITVSDPYETYKLTKGLVDTDRGNNANWEVEGSGVGSGIPITADYADLSALIAAQGTQTDGLWYRALDASDDELVGAGWAIYEYLGTTNGNITDYYLITDQEDLTLLVPSSQTITAANLRSCGTFFFEILEAPGPNKFQAVEKLIVSKKAGAVAFNFTGDIFFKTTGGDVLYMIAANEMNTAANANWVPVRQGQRMVANQALIITTSDGLDASVGDSTLTIKISYTIENVNV